jgi:ERF superfamily protein
VENTEKQEPVLLDVEPIWEVSLSPVWTGALVKALAAAQLKFKPVLKQVDNAAFMRAGKASKYADLAEYIDATQQALAENGLVVTQWPDVSPEAKSMSLVSYLMHTSGEWMRGRLTLPATGRDGFTPQSCGSSITYARRYSYAAITGCASEDDDGNAASGKGTAEAAKAVGERKKQEATERQGTKKDVSCLFYTYPDSHNGHMAEWLNVAEFAAANEDKADSLRMVFTAHKAKKTAAGGALVPYAEMVPLMEKLAGDLGLSVKELKAAQ